MITHVIILAQGQQKRLPTLTVAKQMLRLPACNNTPILHRTIRQLWSLLDMRPRFRPEEPRREIITVVGWLPLCEELARVGVPVQSFSGLPPGVGPLRYCPDICTLVEPGNSSLKGVVRYLLHERENLPSDFTPERTVVLLGDVVYSWRCLRAILDGTHWNMGFVGTSNLSTSDGELWGVSWKATVEVAMFSALADAILKHPPFSEYQPGQLRRWLWAIDEFIDGEFTPKDRVYAPITSSPLDMRRTWFASIDDYTRDIDLPEHVEQLGVLSEKAAIDDAANGVTW